MAPTFFQILFICCTHVRAMCNAESRKCKVVSCRDKNILPIKMKPYFLKNSCFIEAYNNVIFIIGTAQSLQEQCPLHADVRNTEVQQYYLFYFKGDVTRELMDIVLNLGGRLRHTF